MRATPGLRTLAAAAGLLVGAAGTAASAPAAVAAHAAAAATAGRGERDGDRAWHFEEGVASWYGGRFHGRRTASGEIYDKRALTVAHRTLPFDTVLLVTNLDNGRSCRARVTDRGPFVSGRILDASEALAERLGFRDQGLGRVRIEILGRIPEPTERGLSKRQVRKLRRALRRAEARGARSVTGAGAGPELERLPADVLVPVAVDEGPFVVQVGAFAVRENAVRLARRLADAGWPTRLATRPGDELTRVHVGPHATRRVADEAAARLEAASLPSFVTRP